MPPRQKIETYLLTDELPAWTLALASLFVLLAPKNSLPEAFGGLNLPVVDNACVP